MPQSVTGPAPAAVAYPGGELELFARAANWKAYWAAAVGRFVAGRVLEVGAGLGATAAALCAGTEAGWLCLEPDAGLAARIEDKIRRRELPDNCQVRRGTLRDLPAGERFDTILYIDVLEHIADDRDELRAAAGRLAPGGHLVVLAPAHGWLFSPFDAAIGHVRRYGRAALVGLAPDGLVCRRAAYLDSVGLLLSLGNRLLLRRDLPSAAQIAFWDRRIIPLSRILDRLTGHRLGKTVLCVWRRGG